MVTDNQPLCRRTVERCAGQPDWRLYLDLDGVMADFDAHFPALFGVDHRAMLDDDMWATINAHPSYFRDMPPCPGAIEFFRTIECLRPIILTACPKSNYAHVARQKRAWVRQHLSTDCIILPVMGGKNKPLFMHAPGDVLIDDFERNCDAWTADGGIAIWHTSFEDTAQRLRALPNQPARLCTGCEGRPAPGNNPCAVCGLAATQPDRVGEVTEPSAAMIEAGVNASWDPKAWDVHGGRVAAVYRAMRAVELGEGE